MKPVHTILLFVILGTVSIPPLQAFLQLPGSVVVTITSPASGSTVTNTITVNASVNSPGATVAGVQFKVDGLDLGPEDTTVPYSVLWDTTTTVNGLHTLTAVARDAFNNRFNSNPVSVTVVNGNPIVIENQQQGSPNWQMFRAGYGNADDVANQIKGYASATSVNKGSPITFYVTVNPAQTYTMDVYRMGWYQGSGGGCYSTSDH